MADRYDLDALTVEEEVQRKIDVEGFDEGTARLLVHARRGNATMTDIIITTADDSGWVEIDGAWYPSPKNADLQGRA